VLFVVLLNHWKESSPPSGGSDAVTESVEAVWFFKTGLLSFGDTLIVGAAALVIGITLITAGLLASLAVFSPPSRLSEIVLVTTT